METGTPTAEPKAEKIKPLGLANKISFLRLPGAVLTIALHTASSVAGTLSYLAVVSTDAIDGQVARRMNDETKEGAGVDPLMDKALNIPTTAYLMSLYGHNIYLVLAAGASIGVDVVSQALRGPIRKQLEEAYRAAFRPTECTPVTPENASSVKTTKATWPGKLKMGLQVFATTVLLGWGHDEKAQATGAAAYGAAAVSGIAGTLMRNRKSDDTETPLPS